jgi:hypothetical protein
LLYSGKRRATFVGRHGSISWTWKRVKLFDDE